MARRSYGENERRTVERTVQDQEIIEEFMNRLGDGGKAERLLEEHSTSDLEASVEYRLVHPYEGENFAYALMRDEEVTAQVELYIENSNTFETYTGQLTRPATEIFNPASLIETSPSEVPNDSEKARVNENTAMRPSTQVQAETD